MVKCQFHSFLLLLSPYLPTLVLLVATVVGVAGELAGVAAAQPRITGKIAAALGKVFPDVDVSDDSLKIIYEKRFTEYCLGLLGATAGCLKSAPPT